MSGPIIEPGDQVKHWSAKRLTAALVIAAAAWLIVALFCLNIGRARIGWPNSDELPFRLSMVLLASLVGAALGSAGVAYQAVLRNPLADPYLLGASSGAMLATFLWALPGIDAIPFLNILSEQAFSWVGAVAAVSIVLFLAQQRGRLDPLKLLLVGVIVNAINGSVFLLLFHLNLRNDPTSANGGPFRLLVGGLPTSLSIADFRVQVAGASIAAGWLLLLLLSGQLNVAPLADAEASALGTNVHRLRWLAVIAASLMTASAVSLSGPIGFIGLVCPHLARRLVGTDQRKLLPLSTALGAALLAVADALTRFLAAESRIGTHLPVGVVTGLIGGPFFLILYWNNRSRRAQYRAAGTQPDSGDKK